MGPAHGEQRPRALALPLALSTCNAATSLRPTHCRCAAAQRSGTTSGRHLHRTDHHHPAAYPLGGNGPRAGSDHAPAGAGRRGWAGRPLLRCPAATRPLNQLRPIRGRGLCPHRRGVKPSSPVPGRREVTATFVVGPRFSPGQARRVPTVCWRRPPRPRDWGLRTPPAVPSCQQPRTPSAQGAPAALLLHVRCIRVCAPSACGAAAVWWPARWKRALPANHAWAARLPSCCCRLAAQRFPGAAPSPAPAQDCSIRTPSTQQQLVMRGPAGVGCIPVTF